MKTYWVYIITNTHNTVVYIGITSDIVRRMFEHREKMISGFSRKYNLHKLVYLEETSDAKAAIAREKQLKGWARIKKNALIESINPEWNDLSL